jgi:hypothetical protein
MLHRRLVGARDHGADAVEHADTRAEVCAALPGTAPGLKRWRPNFAISDVFSALVMSSSFGGKDRHYATSQALSARARQT